MDFTYIAKRSIIAGHSAGSQYTISFELSDFRRSSSINGKTTTTIDGSEVTVINHDVVLLDISSVIIEDTGTPDVFWMREFLDSVKGKETFTLDDGSGPISVVLNDIKNPYREDRLSPTAYRYSFAARVL